MQKMPSEIEVVVTDVVFHEKLSCLPKDIQNRVGQIDRDTFQKPHSKQRVVIEILSDKEFIRGMWKHLYIAGPLPSLTNEDKIQQN